MNNKKLEPIKLDLAQKISAMSLSLMPSLHKLPPKIFRPLYLMMDRMQGLGKVQMHKIDDHLIPVSYKHSGKQSKRSEIGIRTYYPTEESASSNHDSKQRSLMYFHGGGVVVGSIETHDRFCRYLAKHSNMIILSVDYRLAPEHKFPAPVYDAIDAWNWVNENHKNLNLNPEYIGVGGDSAGAYLSCVIGQPNLQTELTIQSKYMPYFQFLLYPMLSLVGNTESYKIFTKHLILTKNLMDYFRKHFLNSLDEKNLPLVSPLLNNNINTDIKTYILTLGYDPLRDDGIEYAKRLKEAGAEIEHEHFADCMHAFISVAAISKRAKEATYTVAMALDKFNH